MNKMGGQKTFAGPAVRPFCSKFVFYFLDSRVFTRPCNYCKIGGTETAAGGS